MRTRESMERVGRGIRSMEACRTGVQRLSPRLPAAVPILGLVFAGAPAQAQEAGGPVAAEPLLYLALVALTIGAAMIAAGRWKSSTTRPGCVATLIGAIGSDGR